MLNKKLSDKEKFIRVKAKLTEYFETINQGVNIPSWQSAEIKANEWLKEGIIDRQYSIMLKYGYVA